MASAKTVTFPAAGHHRPLTGTKLYWLVTEAHAYEQLAQVCYLKVRGRESNARPSESHRGTSYSHQVTTVNSRQEAQLSPSDRAMRLVSSNLVNYHATVQKLLIRQVLAKPMV